MIDLKQWYVFRNNWRTASHNNFLEECLEGPYFKWKAYQRALYRANTEELHVVVHKGPPEKEWYLPEGW